MLGIGGLMDKLRAQARIGATNLGYGRLRNHKTGKDERGAGHGWHDLTNALLSPPAQSEPNTGELATEQSIIWFASHHRDRSSPGDEQFVESLTRRRTPLSDKQRVWLHDIVAKSKPTREFSRAPMRCGWVLVIKKCPERERAKSGG
jgi:hypothetical protein